MHILFVRLYDNKNIVHPVYLVSLRERLECHLTVSFLLPVKELLIYFSLHKIPFLLFIYS